MFTRAVTAAVLAAATALAALPAAAQPQPDERERTHVTDNFTITWVDDPASEHAPDLTDADGDGVPDGVERMAAAFEGARSFLVDDLGYLPPPGEGRYRLYVARPAGRGHTQPLPGGAGRSRPSFILIPPGRVRPSASDRDLAAWAAHEFFHAVQFGYDAGEDPWIMEATATWVQGIYEPARGSNLSLLSHFVPHHRRGLTEFDGFFEYGAFLFVQFLVERYGGGSVAGAGLVRELWEEMAVPEAIPGAPDRDSIGALEAVLARRGTTLADAWGEFMLWRRQLARFEDGAAYRRALAGSGAGKVLRVSRPRAESCRLTTDDDDGGGLPALSSDTVVLRPHPGGPTRTGARLAARGPEGATGFAIVVPRRGERVIHMLDFDADGVAALDIDFGTGQVRRMVVGLGNGSGRSGATLEYSLRVGDANRVTASSPSVPGSVMFGVSAVIRGTVTCRRLPAAHADVVITETEVVSGETRTLTATTDAHGRWSAFVTPGVTSTYSVEVKDALLSPASGPGTALLGVRVGVTVEVTPEVVEPGAPVIVTGEVFPVHQEAAVVIEFRRPERTWRTGAETTVDADGGYRGEVALPGEGIWQMRARVVDTGDEDHLPGTSFPRFVAVSEAR